MLPQLDFTYGDYPDDARMIVLNPTATSTACYLSHAPNRNRLLTMVI